MFNYAYKQIKRGHTESFLLRKDIVTEAIKKLKHEGEV